MSASSTIDVDTQEQIVNDLNKATEIDPHFTWAYYLFGQFYAKTDKQKAVSYYQKAADNVDQDLAIGLTAKSILKKFYQSKASSISKIK